MHKIKSTVFPHLWFTLPCIENNSKCRVHIWTEYMHSNLEENMTPYCFRLITQCDTAWTFSHLEVFLDSISVWIPHWFWAPTWKKEVEKLFLKNFICACFMIKIDMISGAKPANHMRGYLYSYPVVCRHGFLTIKCIKQV